MTEQKRKNSRYVWLAAAVIWMAVIFGFSSQKADDSSKISGTLAYQIVEGVNSAANFGWKEDLMRQYASLIEHPARKAAHMTEYAILACILLGNFTQYADLSGRRFLWAELGAAMYAATDEFHQLFIEGRSGELKDVFIDSLGAAAGLLLAWAVSSIIKKWKKRKR